MLQSLPLDTGLVLCCLLAGAVSLLALETMTMFRGYVT